MRCAGAFVLPEEKSNESLAPPLSVVSSYPFSKSAKIVLAAASLYFRRFATTRSASVAG
jgi:hypothetical protein